jgi:hypothetical protein
LFQFDQAIKEARAGLDAFLVSVQETKGDIIGSQNANLRELIATRKRLEQHRKMARFAFDDLIRAAIQEYLKSSDSEVLESNLASIKLSFDDTKVPSPLNLPSPGDLCGRNSSPTPFGELKDKVGCVEFPRGERPYAIISTGKRATGFPLLIVEPGGVPLKRSIEQTFVADELSKIELELEPIGEPRQILFRYSCPQFEDKDVRWTVVFRQPDGTLSEAAGAKASTSAQPEEPKAPEHPCPCCGSNMRIIETFLRGQQPKHKPTPIPPKIRIDTS